MGTEAGNKKTRLYISGMECINCQNKIENSLLNTDGIISANVSYSKGVADICYDKAGISLEDIITEIEKQGYKAAYNKKQHSPDLVKTICLLIIIVSLYILLQYLGILNLLAPSRLADNAMGYGMLFVIGLITSVHCIAMCGGINLSQCIPKKEGEEKNRFSSYASAVFYNIGRVLSYTAVGFVLGLAGFVAGGGNGIRMSVSVQGILKIIAGLFMIIMGINMLGIFPWLRRLYVYMPGFIVHRIGRKKTKAEFPFIVGILNGFMPCGPLQSMWVVALATGNPAAGALSMFLFSLGTVPLMLGVGTIVSALGKKFSEKVMTVGDVLIVVLGFSMLSQGGTLSGFLSPDLIPVLMTAFFAIGVLLSIPVENKIIRSTLYAASLAVAVICCVFWNVWKREPAESSSVMIVDGIQVVNSTLEPGSYPDIVVQRGMPVRWIIEAPKGSINGCNYKILIQEYGIEYEFQQGENVIEFIPEQTGTVSYSCWMGMIYGNIRVKEDIDSDN